MMTATTHKTLLLCLYLGAIAISPALAQDAAPDAADFALFEPVETNQAEDNSSRAVSRNTRVTGENSAPAFTLVGTSRIGAQRAAILRHRSGEVLTVRLAPAAVSASTAIPGYETYRIVGAASGRLSIRYPGDTVCAEFPESGVRCGQENIAELSLTASAPPVEEAAEEDSPEQATNPFERIRAQNNAQSGDGNSQRFQPRRIDPADVPPGMRVVSTPFGDRLVEE